MTTDMTYTLPGLRVNGFPFIYGGGMVVFNRRNRETDGEAIFITRTRDGIISIYKLYDFLHESKDLAKIIDQIDRELFGLFSDGNLL